MQHRGRLASVLCALCLLAFTSFWSAEAQAVDPKYLCNSSGSRCVAPTPADWEFGAEIWFGQALPPGPYKSMSELQSAIEAFRSSWCSTTLQSIDMDHVPGPWITSGTSPKYLMGL
jgi:hypothetical protein